jgi:hypothetical protein
LRVIAWTSNGQKHAIDENAHHNKLVEIRVPASLQALLPQRASYACHRSAGREARCATISFLNLNETMEIDGAHIEATN